MKRFLMIAVTVLIFSLLSCSTKQTNYKIDNVVRIFMHEKNYHTFFVQKPGSNAIEEVHLYASTQKFTDVPPDKPMWVNVFENTNSCGDMSTRLEIHLHEIEDVNPAGWNHGKSGRGQTTIIE
jgi:hypothetical protein